MDKQKQRTNRAAIAIMLVVCIGNVIRIIGTENIRTVTFLSIFAVGALSGVLLMDIIRSQREKKDETK